MSFLDHAESIDQYRTACAEDLVNSLARQNQSYTLMSGGKPQSGPYGTTIVQLYPNADGGLPHTRPPNLICVPAYYNLNNETLLHETLHVHQRKNKYDWNSYFYRQGWIPIPEQTIPERWVRRTRLNPDTLDQRFYAWENQWVPLPLFEREDKPDLRSCLVRWWDMRSGSLLSDPPRSFEATFGKNHPQPEHPREVSAVILSRQFRDSTWTDLEDHIKNLFQS